MLPAYFPFTYVSETVAKKINSIFGKFLMYQPIKKLTYSSPKSELFDILIPKIDYEYKIKQTIDEFWGLVSKNYGSKKIDVKLTKIIFREKPFYDNCSIEAIKHEIINSKSKTSKKLPENALFTSCLFLALAQYNDFYNDQFNLDIKNFEIKEKMLTNILQGNALHNSNSNKALKSSYRNNFYEFMCFERIKAWSAIVQESKVMPNFMVTSSFSVLESLMEFGFEFKVLKLDTVNIQCHKINDNDIKMSEHMQNIITQNNVYADKYEVDAAYNTEIDSNATNKATVFILPNLPMHKFLMKISPTKLKIDYSYNTNTKINNTAIVLIN